MRKNIETKLAVLLYYNLRISLLSLSYTDDLLSWTPITSDALKVLKFWFNIIDSKERHKT